MVLIKVPRKEEVKKVVIKNKKIKVNITTDDVISRIYIPKIYYKPNGAFKQCLINLPKCMIGKKFKINLIK